MVSKTISDENPKIPVAIEHFGSLHGLNYDTIAKARLELIPPSKARKLGFPLDFPSDSILIPYHDLDNKPIKDDLGNPAARIRLLKPPEGGPKYLSRAGAGLQVYIPPGLGPILDAARALVITEGELKALSGVQYGLPVIGIQGCSSWHDSYKCRKLADELEAQFLAPDSLSFRTPLNPALHSLITCQDGSPRVVIILGDSDVGWKEDARSAKSSLRALHGAIILQTGAKAVVSYCPPVCEQEWLATNRDAILLAVKGQAAEKRMAKVEQLIAGVLSERPGVLRELSDVLKQYAPGLYDELKKHKTGLDDWILCEKRKAEKTNGHAAEAVAAALRCSTKRASEAIQIEYHPGREDEVVADMKQAIGVAKSLPIFLLDKEVPCIVERDPDGTPHIRPLLSTALLIEHLARRVHLYKADPKSGPQAISISQPLLEIMAQSKRYEWDGKPHYLYRPLRGIRTMPVLADDGAIRAFADGYHDEYIWHIPHLQEILRLVPANPTPEDVRKAANILFQPFRETPFADVESLSSFFELVLTILTRRGTPTAPAFLITSPSAGTGKTYLARMLAYLVAGEMPDTLPWPTQRGGPDEEEIKKLFMTLLLTKPPVALFDNIASGSALSSTVLEMIITAPSWKGRLLGGNKYVRMSTDTTLIFTGNNVALTGDSPSRFQSIRLTSELEDAHTRAYRHRQAEWMCWIDANRPALVAALLIIQRAFILSGQAPEIAEALSKQSRFQEWQFATRLPVIWLGSLGVGPTGQPLVDPETSVRMHNIDPSFEIEARIVHSLHGVFDTAPFAVRDITTIARKDIRSEAEQDLLDAIGIDDRRGSHTASIRLGTRVAKLIGKWVRGKRIVKAGADSRSYTALYCIEVRDPSGGPGKPEDDSFTKPTTPITAAEQAEMGCTDTYEASEGPEEADTDAVPKPLQETPEIPDDVLDDISEPLPKIAPEPQPVPFLAVLTAEHRNLLHVSPWVSFDLETTALSRASAPVVLTPKTQIGGTPWKKYQDTHSPKADTAPRARILSCTVQNSEGVRTLAWDLDALDDATKTELFGLCISGKTLIGHNLSFDLSWAAWYTDAQPARVLDTMLLIRSLWPDLPLTLHERGMDGDGPTAKVLNASRPSTLAGIGLASVAAALGLELPQGKAYQGPANWVPNVLTPEHCEYVVSDTTIALEVLHRILEHFGLSGTSAGRAWEALEAQNPPGWPAYRDAFAPAIPLLAGMHRLGLPLDTKGLEALLAVKDKEARERAEELIQMIPELEPYSIDLIRGGLPDGAKRAVYDHVMLHGIDVGVTGISKAPAVSDKSLKKTGADQLPFFKPWEGLREAVKIRQMLESLRGLSGVDGRLHSLISIAAATGRTTSQEPNAQNFPRDPAFRALVRAREGHTLVDADLGSIEMRIAAALAERAIQEFGPKGPRKGELPGWFNQDAAVAKMAAARWRSRLSAVFRSGIDPHIATGLALMRAAGEAPPDMPEDIIGWLAGKTPEERQAIKKMVGGWRQKAKALNFGLLYGQSAEGLYDYGLTVFGLTWSPEEAEAARNVWFDTYPEVRFWQRVTELACSQYRPLTTRDRYSGKLECKNQRVFKATTLSGRPLSCLTVQSILNYQDQGTGAEMLLMAMARLPEDLQPCIVDIIHDEVLLEVPESQADYAREALEKAMVKAAEALLKPWGIGAEADAATGATWAEVKK